MGEVRVRGWGEVVDVDVLIPMTMTLSLLFCSCPRRLIRELVLTDPRRRRRRRQREGPDGHAYATITTRSSGSHLTPAKTSIETFPLLSLPFLICLNLAASRRVVRLPINQAGLVCIREAGDDILEMKSCLC